MTTGPSSTRLERAKIRVIIKETGSPPAKDSAQLVSYPRGCRGIPMRDAPPGMDQAAEEAKADEASRQRMNDRVFGSLGDQ